MRGIFVHIVWTYAENLQLEQAQFPNSEKLAAKNEPQFSKSWANLALFAKIGLIQQLPWKKTRPKWRPILTREG